MSLLTPHPSTEQPSTAISSLPANISTSFPHSVSTQPHQFTTQHTPPCTTSHKALHTFLTTMPLSEQYFLGHFIFPPSIQHFLSDIHSNKFTMASDGSVRAPTVPSHGSSTAPNQKPTGPATTPLPKDTRISSLSSQKLVDTWGPFTLSGLYSKHSRLQQTSWFIPQYTSII